MLEMVANHVCGIALNQLVEEASICLSQKLMDLLKKRLSANPIGL
ncbi:hypothetical protein D8I24_0562 (plasmid) [Cupriavidus necator H850]|nr:hypothetical protein D8I24_0562 [Cupriavidus necator H850]